MTFPAHHSQHLACLPPSLLVSAIVPHFWLTNKIKAPTAINTAIRTPTTNDVTGCRLGLTSFDLALFCAAPIPNQKRSLSIDPCLALSEAELTASWLAPAGPGRNSLPTRQA